MRNLCLVIAVSFGLFRFTQRSRKKAACHVSWWLSSKRSVFLKLKRSITRVRKGALSRMASYNMRVSEGVKTLFVRSARSEVRSTTAFRRPSKHRRSASA
jgi:hypothetical protein